MAGDPFDDARYAIGVKDNATALRLVDSRQFDINMQNAEGYTLLHFAAGAGNLDMVDALLQRGANPTLKNSLGMTPLQSAIGTMVAARIKTAIDNWGKPGARAAAPRGTGDFDKIRYAIQTRNNAGAIAELDKGIDVNMATSEGYTLLHYAAEAGNLEMVKELLRRGANANARAPAGGTPYDMAIGTMVQAEIRNAGGQSARPAPAAPRPSAPAPKAPVSTAAPKQSSAPQSERAKMCEQRHLSSSSLCGDSTCRMREYRKWQTCLQTGSYY